MDASEYQKTMIEEDDAYQRAIQESIDAAKGRRWFDHQVFKKDQETDAQRKAREWATAERLAFHVVPGSERDKELQRQQETTAEFLALPLPPEILSQRAADEGRELLEREEFELDEMQIGGSIGDVIDSLAARIERHAIVAALVKEIRGRGCILRHLHGNLRAHPIENMTPDLVAQLYRYSDAIGDYLDYEACPEATCDLSELSRQ